jgi:hypothetical protein
VTYGVTALTERGTDPFDQLDFVRRLFEFGEYDWETTPRHRAGQVVRGLPYPGRPAIRDVISIVTAVSLF